MIRETEPVRGKAARNAVDRAFNESFRGTEDTWNVERSVSASSLD